MGLTLGLIAGGAAKGFAQGEELKAERARKEALEQETKFKRDANTRDEQRRGALQGVPIPGVTQITGRDYDPSADIEGRVAAATPPPHQRAGLLGALGKFLDRDAAAIGSGVKPPGAMPGATPGAPSAGVMPGDQPQLPMPQVPAAPGTVEEVTVTGSKPKPRAATEEDAAKYRWAVARRMGDADGERVAAKEFFDIHIGNLKKGIAFADTADMANMIDEVRGTTDTNIEQNDKGEYEVYFGKNKVATAKNRDELNGLAISAIDRTPEAGIALAANARTEQRQSMLANAQMAGIAENIRRSKQQGAISVAQEGRQATSFAQGQAEKAQLNTALDFLRNPNNAVLYPEQWEAAAQTAWQFMPEAAKGNIGQTDSMGNRTNVPVNNISVFGQQHRANYESNPWVQGGYISVGMYDGKPTYAVRSKSGAPIPASTLSAAEQAAKRLYGAKPPAAGPAPKKAAVPSAATPLM